MIFWIFFLISSLIVEVYLWWKLQASLIFLSGRTCTIGGWLNTFLPHCIYIFMSIYQSVYLSVSLSICLSLSLSLSLSVSRSLSTWLFLYPYFPLYVSLPIYLSASIYLSVSLSISIYPFVCLSLPLSLSVCLSLHLSTCLSLFIYFPLPLSLLVSLSISVRQKKLLKTGFSVQNLMRGLPKEVGPSSALRVLHTTDFIFLWRESLFRIISRQKWRFN